MKIKIHNHLDQKILDKNENMNPDVKDMLISIAWAYIDFIRNEYDMPVRNSDVADIFVFGSITQLFYDKKSDIDICIVLDFDSIQKNFPNMNIEQQLKLYYYDWAMVHICKIYGRKIDLNFSNKNLPEYNGQYRTGPIYSILSEKWLLPTEKLSHSEIRKIERQSTAIYKQILHDYKVVKKNGFKIDEIKKLYGNIIASKEGSLKDECDHIINPVYMAIRKFKHNGYIDKLRNKAIKQETAKYVLK